MTTARPHHPQGALGEAGVPLWCGVASVPEEFRPCVVIVGVFDGVHRGHRYLIDHARSVGRDGSLPVLLVLLEPPPPHAQDSARGPGSLTTVADRARFAAEAGVDAICVLPAARGVAGRTAEDFVRTDLIEGLRAAAVVVGKGHRITRDDALLCEKLTDLGPILGFAAHCVPLLHQGGKPCSSGQIRSWIQAGDLTQATCALGRPHLVRGYRLGEAVRLAGDVVLPPPGRYRALIDDQTGSVDVDPAGWLWLIETDHDFSGDPVTVTFLDHDGNPG